ncbi:MAG: septal ring lytic transglycosylase RlpA family protein [Legionella sp.]|jgi:rare lipoprotein A|nr:septal ring lytic transglycosylase RlpA family protein [Legionella sp.]
MRRLGLVLMSLCFMAGCQTHRVKQISSPSSPTPPKLKKIHRYTRDTHDGAPSGPLPTEFKKVSPIQEPLSRYGNPTAYHVNGVTYHVLPTSKGYRKRGLASWYGTKFHEQRTSSGEAYDMYALTAAHKTLPLPSYVQVKNLKNGRKIIVKVNDRGPFHEGRIIDLSYAAGVKLGLLPEGTAPVEVKALSSRAQKKIPEARYYLQAGAFKSKASALAYRDQLLKLTPAIPMVIEEHLANQIVRLGPMGDKKQADQVISLLKSKGVQGVFSFLE